MIWLPLYRKRFWLIALFLTVATLFKYSDRVLQQSSTFQHHLEPGNPRAATHVHTPNDDRSQQPVAHKSAVAIGAESLDGPAGNLANADGHSPKIDVTDEALQDWYQFPTIPPAPVVQAANPDYKSIQSKVLSLIKPWSLSEHGQPGHWPTYDNYKENEYDPDKWEQFEWDTGFYIGNGVRNLGREGHRGVPYNPYPAYNTEAWKEKWIGTYTACKGPRGNTLGEGNAGLLRAYPILPDAFPAPLIGDANATGIDISMCFDRHNRYGPYGMGTSSGPATVEDGQQPRDRPDWEKVDWAALQDECNHANHGRYTALEDTPNGVDRDARKDGQSKQSLHPRTAILLRTWEGFNYTENDKEVIRALVTETSLMSGGEYEVFLFVNVKDIFIDFYNNETIYRDILNNNVPSEFHSMSVLWSEKVLEGWYPKVGDWQVYWSQFMSLQWFSKTHQQFDYVWNWEMDVRYTGNHYAFFEALSDFSKKYPRKHMWERNQRYYIPSAHGHYTEWLKDTDRKIKASGVDPVWGPMPYRKDQKPIGPKPPRRNNEDSFSWGVGEEADLITLLPLWDPRNTRWDYRDKIWNFIDGVRPHFTAADGADIHFTHPGFADISRRVYINTVSRLSKRMLHAMHLENEAGRTMQAEMWPGTVALHHGLKAVYAPHPIWSDRKWPPWYADAVFNADGGKLAGWGINEDAPYAHDREHNFGGWSWYFDSTFPKNLYRRWLGWSSDEVGSPFMGMGGEEFEERGVDIEPSSPGQSREGEEQKTSLRVGGAGRMCLPAMLLHPVKKTFKEAEGPP